MPLLQHSQADAMVASPETGTPAENQGFPDTHDFTISKSSSGVIFAAIKPHEALNTAATDKPVQAAPSSDLLLPRVKDFQSETSSVFKDLIAETFDLS